MCRAFLFSFVIFAIVYAHGQSPLLPPSLPEVPVEQDIVVTARNPCSPTNIKADLDYEYKPSNALFDSLNRDSAIYEYDDFSRSRYDLSCEGKPNCRGHIFSNTTGKVEVALEPRGLSLSLSGNITQCKRSLEHPELHRHCRYEDYQSSYDTRPITCEPDPDPKDPTCQVNRRLEERFYVPRENILNAGQSNVSLTCEPGRCRSYQLNNMRNSQYVLGNYDNVLVVVRKNKSGIETTELIVNASSVTVYADDELNVGRRSFKLKACPSTEKVERRARSNDRRREKEARRARGAQ